MAVQIIPRPFIWFFFGLIITRYTGLIFMQMIQNPVTHSPDCPCILTDLFYKLHFLAFIWWWFIFCCHCKMTMKSGFIKFVVSGYCIIEIAGLITRIFPSSGSDEGSTAIKSVSHLERENVNGRNRTSNPLCSPKWLGYSVGTYVRIIYPIAHWMWSSYWTDVDRNWQFNVATAKR